MIFYRAMCVNDENLIAEIDYTNRPFAAQVQRDATKILGGCDFELVAIDDRGGGGRTIVPWENPENEIAYDTAFHDCNGNPPHYRSEAMVNVVRYSDSAPTLWVSSCVKVHKEVAARLELHWTQRKRKRGMEFTFVTMAERDTYIATLQRRRDTPWLDECIKGEDFDFEYYAGLREP